MPARCRLGGLSIECFDAGSSYRTRSFGDLRQLVRDSTHLDAPLWTIELTLIASTTATEPEARDALRGIKARRRKGDPMACCCCPTTLGAAPFTLVLGRGNDDAIPPAEAGLCRRCAPDLKEAGERALQVVRGIWPALIEYRLSTRCLRSED